MILNLIALFESAIQLVPDGTIFLHILLILLMVGILNRTLFQPISGILKERERRGGGALGEAAQLHQQKEVLTEQYQSTLRSARSAKYRLIEDQRTEALRERKEKLALVKQEIDAAKEREKAGIQLQAEAAREVLSRDAMSIATDIRNQILKPVE